jgi:hypothetical protein
VFDGLIYIVTKKDIFSNVIIFSEQKSLLIKNGKNKSFQFLKLPITFTKTTKLTLCIPH